MSGDFPFHGNSNRVSVFGFYKANGFGPKLQQEYCETSAAIVTYDRYGSNAANRFARLAA